MTEQQPPSDDALVQSLMTSLLQGNSGSPAGGVFPTGAQTYGSTVPGSGTMVGPQGYGPGGSLREVQNYDPDPHRLEATKAAMLQQLLVTSVNDPDSIISLQQKLIRGGYLSPRAGFVSGDVNQDDATWNAVNVVWDKAIQTKTDWTKLLEDRIKAGTGNKAWQYYLKKFGADGLNAGADGVDTGVDRTDVSRQTRVSTKMDAQGLLETSLRNSLGRDPNSQELSAFTNALQAYEKANPQVTTTHTVGDSEMGTTSSSSTVGGANDQVFAENYGMKTDTQDEVASLRGRQYVDIFERMMRGD